MERNNARSDSASPESTRPSVYSEAFQVWKAARELFTTALKAYADASTALEAICVGNQASSKAARTEMEKVLTALEPELQQISLDVEQVTKTTKTLKVLRNQSTTLVPISRLPPKVFMRIFQSLMHLDPQDPAPQTGFWPFPETVAHVCSSWRQVSFDDSQLWGRIDLNISKAHGARSYKDAKARSEYARDSRLDVRIYQDSPSSIIHAERAIKFLDQIAPRLGAISCRSFGYYNRDLMVDTLVSWFQHGTFGTLSELHLFRYRNNQSSQDLAKNLSMARLDGWLSSVRYLTLQHVFIGWSSQVYHNLVELSLWFDEHSYDRTPTEQFVGALSVSPMLRVLKLCGLQLSSQSAPSGLEPVRLDKLEVFFLKKIESNTIEVLLPLLQPGPTPIYMTFGSDMDYFGLDSCIPFLRRSPVARLMIRGFTEITQPNAYFEAFQIRKAAQDHFTTAVKVYADASAALEVECVGNPVSDKATQLMVEQVLAALVPELPQISLDLDCVIKTTKSLKVLRIR
ncbi:hypothetical protein FRC06_007251, partial [Ceratobasidium sp. 370]